MKVQNIQSSNSFRGKFARINHVGSIAYDSNWHKNSSIIKMLGENHHTPTGQVYFADPLENVSQANKLKADYIVYDNEPNIPNLNEVKENYFGKTRKDFGKDYQELADYYARREQGGFSDKNWDKHLENVAKDCKSTYDEGCGYRLEKEKTEDKIKILTDDKAQLEQKISKAKDELKSQETVKTKLSKHISDLKDNKNITKNEQELYEISNKKLVQKDSIILQYRKLIDTKNIYNEIIAAKNNNLKKSNNVSLQTTIKTFNTIKEHCTETIKDLTKYISNLENNLALINNKIIEKQSIIEDCKKKLEPLFDKLISLYSENNIRPIKRFYR